MTSDRGSAPLEKCRRKTSAKSAVDQHISMNSRHHTGQILYVRKLQGSWNPENGVKSGKTPQSARNYDWNARRTVK